MEKLENSSTEFNNRRWSIRGKALTWFSLVFTVTTILTYLLFIQVTIREADKILQEDLVKALDGAAERVNVNMLLALAENGEANSEGFSDDPRYIELLEWLDTVHKIEPDVWPYLYIESEEPGHINFVVDLYAKYDKETSAEFMETYESQSGYILIGLEEQTFRAVNPVAEFFEKQAARMEEKEHPRWQAFYTAIANWVYKSWLFPGRDFGTYTDKYGRWASAYTPLDTAPGQPRAGLGMDYRAEMVEALHQTVRARLAVFYVVAYFIGYGIMIIFTNKLTNPIIALRRKAELYGNESSSDIFTPGDEKKHPDEIDELEGVLSQMVEKIRRRDQRYEALVTAQSDLIARWQSDGTFTYLNPAFESYFPQLLGTNINKSDFDNIQPEDQESTRYFIEHTLSSLTVENPQTTLEVTVKIASGEIRCIQFILKALFSPQGELEEFQAVGRDITELKNINTQLDQANRKLHNLNHQLLNEREQDRAELARELHDEILNYISELFMSTTDMPSVSAQEIYHKLVERVRNTIYDLRPPMLNYGLYLGLEDYVDGLSERYGSNTNLQFNLLPSEVRFDPNVEIQIFRIVQEACSNALMHSEASQVRINGEITSEVVSITIEDNGLGFDYSRDSEPTTYGSGMKFGLVGMRERAGLIGANLQVDSIPDQGTKIQLTWAAGNKTKQL